MEVVIVVSEPSEFVRVTVLMAVETTGLRVVDGSLSLSAEVEVGSSSGGVVELGSVSSMVDEDEGSLSWLVVGSGGVLVEEGPSSGVEVGVLSSGVLVGGSGSVVVGAGADDGDEPGIWLGVGLLSPTSPPLPSPGMPGRVVGKILPPLPSS